MERIKKFKYKLDGVNRKKIREERKKPVPYQLMRLDNIKICNECGHDLFSGQKVCRNCDRDL